MWPCVYFHLTYIEKQSPGTCPYQELIAVRVLLVLLYEWGKKG